MMKLTAGLGSVDDYTAFAQAGADEVFIGYIPMMWQLEYGLKRPLNRREVWSCGAQIGGENELIRLKKLGAKAAITINALYYRPEEYPVIAKIIEHILEIGFDTFIIADLALIVYLNTTGLAKRINIHVSGEIGEMNRFLLAELKRLGARRIIFNRKATLEEIAALTRDGLEYEAFFMNENCRFSGGYCMSLHCDEMPPICREECRPLPESRTGIDGCGLCALYRLSQAGITHLKIVGRGARREDMLSSIALSKRALILLEESKDEQSYISAVKAILPDGACGGNCYYPEVME